MDSEPYLTPAYNEEAEASHTFHVGDAGGRVHNSDYPKREAAKIIDSSTELGAACFDGEVEVHVEEVNEHGERLRTFEELKVGDRVLSRCEHTGVMAYKRIVKIFSHGFRQQYNLTCKYGPEVPVIPGLPGPLFVTEEHPFWVEGKGWVPVRDLRPGDELYTYNGVLATLKSVAKTGVHEVFNIEVEDFHTYFVHWTGLWVHNEKAPVNIFAHRLDVDSYPSAGAFAAMPIRPAMTQEPVSSTTSRSSTTPSAVTALPAILRQQSSSDAVPNESKVSRHQDPGDYLPV